MLSDEAVETLHKLETDLWRDETRSKLPYMQRLVAEDFIEIGQSGRIYDRAAVLSVSRHAIAALLPHSHVLIRSLSEMLAQVTYDSRIRRGRLVYAHRRFRSGPVRRVAGRCSFIRQRRLSRAVT